MTLSRTPLAEEMLRRFAAAVRSGQLYATDHPIVGRNVTALAAAIEQLHGVEPSIVIGIVAGGNHRRRRADCERRRPRRFRPAAEAARR